MLDDDDHLRSAQRVVTLLREQLAAQRSVADAAVEQVMLREEEAVGLVAERRDRAREARDRLGTEAAQAAAELEALEKAIQAALAARSDIEQRIKDLDRSVVDVTKQSQAYLRDVARPKGPIWDDPAFRPAAASPGRLLREDASISALLHTPHPAAASGRFTSSSIAVMSPQERLQHAQHLGKELRSGIAALEKQFASRDAELQCVQTELADLLAETDTFTASEQELRAQLKEVSAAVTSAASTRLRMPLLRRTLEDRERKAARLRRDMQLGLQALIQQASADEAAITQSAALADQPAGGGANSIVQLAAALRREKASLEELVSAAVSELETYRVDREREVTMLRADISRLENDAMVVRQRRADLCM
jgi:chromosome segregation ATPase